jgi:flagellar motor switch protein FliG
MPEAAISGERELTGPEKAAALLLMMGKPPAARLLKQFEQSDLQVVARAAAGLGAISATTLDRLVDEFVADFSAGADLLGDAGQVKNLLATALPPEQIADILGSASDEPEQPDVWRALAHAPQAAIIALLMAERATTATYILSKIDPAVATKVVAALPRDRRNAALCGLVAPLDVTPLAARLVEEAVESAFETGAKVRGRRGRTVAPRRHHKQPRSGGGRGRHTGSRTGPAEGCGDCEDDAVLLQRSAKVVRARPGALVRSRLDRHRRYGA